MIFFRKLKNTRICSRLPIILDRDESEIRVSKNEEGCFSFLETRIMAKKGKQGLGTLSGMLHASFHVTLIVTRRTNLRDFRKRCPSRQKIRFDLSFHICTSGDHVGKYYKCSRSSAFMEMVG